MILFGSRTRSKVLATLTLLCSRCGNPAANHVGKRSTWFTLFFVPVIPLYFRRHLTCTFCGVSTKLTKAEADRLIAGGQGSPGAPQPRQGQVRRSA